MSDPRKTSQWQRLRLQCYERDRKRGAPCHICGQPIDYSLAPSSAPDAYEPDHLRAVAALTMTPDMSVPAAAATVSFRTSIIGTRRTIPKAAQPDKNPKSRSVGTRKTPFAKLFMTHIIP